MSESNRVIAGSGFHHVAVKVKDFDGTVAFYEGLGFEAKLTWGEDDKRAVMFDMGDGNCVEVFAGGPPPGESNGAILHFAVRTDDCDSALEAARAAGAEVTREPYDVTVDSRPEPMNLRIAFVRAPGGEIIEFFQQK